MVNAHDTHAAEARDRAQGIGTQLRDKAEEGGAQDTVPIMRIRIGGRIPGNRWSEPRPSVKPGVNSGRGGHGFALGPTVLNVLCTTLDHISGLRLN